MAQHDFTSIEDFRGAALPYFTTHTELVRLQREAIAAKRARTGLAKDDEWEGKLLPMCIKSGRTSVAYFCFAAHENGPVAFRRRCRTVRDQTLGALRSIAGDSFVKQSESMISNR